MALKIFISSVSGDFDSERSALREEISAMQDIFIGMEFFGSDPTRPIDYCLEQVRACDLFLVMAGSRPGSVEPATGLPFTRLEYLEARQKKPVLVYISRDAMDNQRQLSTTVGVTQQDFLRELLTDQLITKPFQDTTELRLQFLKDFIKLIRKGLFSVQIAGYAGPIASDLLHRITKATLEERIKTVGQDKYIREIYTRRNAESELSAFTNFEQLFLKESQEILQKLLSAAKKWDFFEHASVLISAISAAILQGSLNFQGHLQALKTAFKFEEVAALKGKLDEVIQINSPVELNRHLHDLVSELIKKNYIRHQRNAEDFIEEIRKALDIKQYIVKGSPRYKNLVEVFPIFIKPGSDFTFEVANDLILRFCLLCESYTKTSIVIVDKAGSGKTNLACHIAERLNETHPVMLLSGQMELSHNYDIEFHIQALLEAKLGGFFADWINRIDQSLHESGRWFYIILDGINESRNRALLKNVLLDFLPKARHKRIRLILTCRDLFWDTFKSVLSPYLFQPPVRIANFSPAEWEEAVGLYFGKYQISCKLSKAAVQALKSPLLLRFFCEANQGKKLGFVDDIKLLNIFDLYLTNVNQDICGRLGYTNFHLVTNLLIDISALMWQNKITELDKHELDQIPSFQQGTENLYELVLNENIIIEEQPHPYALTATVRFQYDEFMEYLLARMLFDRFQRRIYTLEDILREAVNALEVFPAVFGALLFLDQIPGTEGLIVNAFIKYCFKTNTLPRQLLLIYAFNRMNLNMIDDELVAALEKFYHVVDNEHKDQLAAVMLKILPMIPNHAFTKKYVRDVLEVHLPEDTMNDRQTSRPTYETENSIPTLPPARYHYSDESRLNAIILLIEQKQDNLEEVLMEGIDRAGRNDIHLALTALRHLEFVEDQLLFKTLRKYAVMNLAEYRLLSAWLLRRRYGKEAADLLFALLTDRETRVHEYVFGLFAQRKIETELLQQLVATCQNPALKTWHLVYCIKLIGSPNIFRPGTAVDENSVRTLLSSLFRHEKPIVRLEAFRACKAYPELFEKTMLIRQMRNDADQLIQKEAQRMVQ